MRKIKVYAVVKTCEDIDKSLDHILTIVKNKKQASEYILCRFYAEYFPAFSYWCELHNYDNKDKEAFKTFMVTRYDEEELNKYTVIAIKYTFDQLCALIRMLAKFYPMGTNYETDAEIQQFLNEREKEEKKENC